MKRFVCKMCGSSDLIKKDDMYICQFCGAKYTNEEAKKLIVEGTVKIDASDELNNLYELARRARRNNDTQNAQRYYEQIIVKDPSNWEPNFYTVYYQASNCKIADIGIQANRLNNCEKSVFDLIDQNIKDTDKKRNTVSGVATDLNSIMNMLFNACKSWYDSLVGDKSHFVQQYVNDASSCVNALYNAGNYIIGKFGDNYKNISIMLWNSGIEKHKILLKIYNKRDKKYNKSVIYNYESKISSYQEPLKSDYSNKDDNDQKGQSFHNKRNTNSNSGVGLIIYSIVFWILSVFNIFMSIAPFTLKKPFSGIILIVSGIIINPMINSLFTKKGHRIPIATSIIIFIVGLILGMTFIR